MRRILPWLLVGTLVGLLIGTVIGIRLSRPEPLNLADLNSWTLIKAFHGILDPQEGHVTVRVYVFKRLSDSSDPRDVFQNKIVVTRGDTSAHFNWSNDKEFAAGWCEITDLDGDGIKEFLLFAGSQNLRVVSYSQGNFYFRPRQDEILSLGFDVGPFDLNQDGQLEFVEGVNYPEDWTTSGKAIYFPRIRRWSRLKGFEDMSPDFPGYYTHQAVPRLNDQLSKEKDPNLQRLYREAIRDISVMLGQPH